MALLVNYEGTYLPPQKLWYLVDGVWTEVKQIFENNAQNEIAILDQNRIKQDQVVAGLLTKIVEIQSKLNGEDPTVPKETDPDKITSLNKEIEILNLQLTVSKTEQVVLTKTLFEQKAQMEYIKLVSEGESALSKIANNVSKPAEWLCIRIAPQSSLDERLEIAIQHGLADNGRIFNYGLVYYRLIKITSGLDIDNVEYLKKEFTRRLSKTAFEKGTEATNFILTVDTIQNVYMEVNQFVNSGAKRIEDYLFSIREQQKYILDDLAKAKEAIIALESMESDLLIKNEDGLFIANTSQVDLKVPLGKNLLTYQEVESFDQLVSTRDLNDIANGTKDLNDYPGISKLNKDANSLNEKLTAIKDFQDINLKIQNDLVSGKITFNLTILTEKKVALNAPADLFWSTPLGNSTISNAGGTLTYKSTYTSSGAYKFKNDELIKLSTTYIAIINALAYGKDNIIFGVTFDNVPAPKIIQVVNGALYAYNESLPITRAVQTKIINAEKANTKELNFSKETFVNKNSQSHTSIISAQLANTVTTDPNITLSVYQPTINGLFYSNIEELNFSPAIKFGMESYAYAFSISQIPAAQTPTNEISKSFDFNTKEIPLFDYFINNDNIITQIKEEIKTDALYFNTKEIPLVDYYNDNIITQIKEEIKTDALYFNTKSESSIQRNDNIIEQKDIKDCSFLFNSFQTNNYDNIKNGYGVLSMDYSVGTLSEATGLSLITPTLNNYSAKNPEADSMYFIKSNQFKNYKFELGQKTRIIISSQTGITIKEFIFPEEKLNKLNDTLVRMLTATAVKVKTFDFTNDKLNNINSVKELTIPQISTNTKILNTYIDKNEVLNRLNNSIVQVTTLNNTLVSEEKDLHSGTSLLNKDLTSIIVSATQLNPGILLD